MNCLTRHSKAYDHVDISILELTLLCIGKIIKFFNNLFSNCENHIIMPNGLSALYHILQGIT